MEHAWQEPHYSWITIALSEITTRPEATAERAPSPRLHIQAPKRRGQLHRFPDITISFRIHHPQATHHDSAITLIPATACADWTCVHKAAVSAGSDRHDDSPISTLAHRLVRSQLSLASPDIVDSPAPLRHYRTAASSRDSIPHCLATACTCLAPARSPNPSFPLGGDKSRPPWVIITLPRPSQARQARRRRAPRRRSLRARAPRRPLERTMVITIICCLIITGKSLEISSQPIQHSALPRRRSRRWPRLMAPLS